MDFDRAFNSNCEEEYDFMRDKYELELTKTYTPEQFIRKMTRSFPPSFLLFFEINNKL